MPIQYLTQRRTKSSFQMVKRPKLLKKAQIVRALYGHDKSAGALFQNHHLPDCMCHHGWESTKADQDASLKLEDMKDNGCQYYTVNCLLYYVDNTLVVHHDGVWTLS